MVIIFWNIHFVWADNCYAKFSFKSYTIIIVVKIQTWIFQTLLSEWQKYSFQTIKTHFDLSSYKNSAANMERIHSILVWK